MPDLNRGQLACILTRTLPELLKDALNLLYVLIHYSHGLPPLGIKVVFDFCDLDLFGPKDSVGNDSAVLSDLTGSIQVGWVLHDTMSRMARSWFQMLDFLMEF